MDFQIISNGFIATLLMLFLSTGVDSVLWSCSQDGKAIPFIPNQVAGVWYEVGRLPSSEVPACLKVTVPEAQLKGEYTLQLDYINNVNNGWKPTKEYLVFPWAEAENGNFNLIYSDSTVNMSVKFKFLGSMKGYSVVCGYTDFASGLSIIRILGRNKLVNNSVKEKIDVLASRYHINLSELTWVQQDGRCNGSNNLPLFPVGVWIILFCLQTTFANSLFC